MGMMLVARPKPLKGRATQESKEAHHANSSDACSIVRGVGDLVIEPVYTTSDGPLRDAILLDFASDGTLFFGERRGFINQLDPQTGERIELIELDVMFAGEQGLVGIALEPAFDFHENNYIYAFYTPAAGEGDFRRMQLSRFRYHTDADGVPYIDPASEEMLHQVFVDQGLHVGGDIRFGPDGKLYVAIGDNTQWGYWSQIDRRPGFEAYNALRTSQNSLELRGKILRLNPDGSIPRENPFVDDRGVRSEVWAMGLRNPYRIHIDPVTGWVASRWPHRRRVRLQRDDAGPRLADAHRERAVSGARCG